MAASNAVLVVKMLWTINGNTDQELMTFKKLTPVFINE
ncbi:hypothetical protein JCM19233_6526 [Vibrio astriarenae]|nr:hypothetical protein JCM19233_6526 [Vibrio sp. C7]